MIKMNTIDSKNRPLWTRSGARLQLVRTSSHGKFHWLFLPGGPGLGSESLLPLLDILELPGNTWRLDLPGDGSNTMQDNKKAFSHWSQALIEAVSSLDNVVLVGHSRGGMFALSTPELQEKLAGLVLITSSPDMVWQNELESKLINYQIPEADEAGRKYEENPSNELLRDCVIAAAPRMFFTQEALKNGIEVLSNLPYNYESFQWTIEHFDPTYHAKWVPQMPTLILSGEKDIAIPIHHFKGKKEYQLRNIIMKEIPGAGHFPWIENPQAVVAAFSAFVKMLS